MNKKQRQSSPRRIVPLSWFDTTKNVCKARSDVQREEYYVVAKDPDSEKYYISMISDGCVISTFNPVGTLEDAKAICQHREQYLASDECSEAHITLWQIRTPYIPAPTFTPQMGIGNEDEQGCDMVMRTFSIMFDPLDLSEMGNGDLVRVVLPIPSKILFEYDKEELNNYVDKTFFTGGILVGRFYKVLAGGEFTDVVYVQVHGDVAKVEADEE